MDIPERYRRQPITGETLVGIIAPTLREFRRQADAQVDAKIAGVNAKLDELRQELGLPVAKARVRVPVGKGATW